MVKLAPDMRRFVGWAHRRRLGERGGDLSYAVHAALTAAFGDQAPKPFRLYERRSRIAPSEIAAADLYGYTGADGPTLLDHARTFADPEIASCLDVESLATKAMPVAWESGRRLGFEVRVRPVLRRDRPGNRDAACERDAFQAACQQAEGDGAGASIELPRRESVYRDWLAGRLGASGGARLIEDSVRLATFQRLRVARRRAADAIRAPAIGIHRRSRRRPCRRSGDNRRLRLRDAAEAGDRQAPRFRLRHAAAAAGGRGAPMLKGRLGLETARMPHADRHGLLWLERGTLSVEDGCLRFVCAGGGALAPGDYQVPHQAVSMILLGPGGSVTHDALRLLARHGAALAAVGEDGVRSYTAPPLMTDQSDIARRQVRCWADAEGARISIARKMYAWRLGEVLPHREIAVLRGIEGARMKELYRLTAQRFGVQWQGRRYDRGNPAGDDLPNQAINHAATAVEAAAAIAVMATATVPQLGFIHEDSGQSFVLDVADLFRDAVTLPIAFQAAARAAREPEKTIDRLVRRITGQKFRRDQVIPAMIDRIKELFDAA
ncbi:MAG: type I-E CRISPR-associated endonuclease Cas1e [Allosphingosinicella sp.]